MEDATIGFSPFCVPYIQRNIVRVFWGGEDVTPPVDHHRNRSVCRLVNERNAEIAARYDNRLRRIYYHYDALTGRALECEIPLRANL